MNDIAIAIIIVAVLFVSAPVWIPLLYLLGITALGVFVGIAGFALVMLAWLIVSVEKLFSRKA